MKTFSRFFLVTLIFSMCAFNLVAQEPAAAQQPTVTQEHQAVPEHAPTHESPNAAIGKPLAEASKEAGGEGEGEEHAEFKQSASVKWFAQVTHLPIKAAYWLAVLLNFAILAGIVYVISKSSIPAALRSRSASIQKGIADARQASEEANAKLRDVEARLAKLDTEVAQIKASAETDFAAEELRIRQSAEEDARRVIEMAQQEIGAAAKTARRDLTAYAADLAVGLAAKKIKVTESDDRALVNRFVSQLGKDGK
jgi:F-type H+-transporting ATPase subunit b